MPGEKSSILSAQYLALYFNGTPIPNIADNAASSPLTNLYCSLHTADPTSGGNQTASEVSYTGYARVAVSRNASGWTLAGASVSPTNNIVFPVPTGSPSATATFWAVGTTGSGAGIVGYTGPITPPIVITATLPPTLTPATTVTEA